MNDVYEHETATDQAGLGVRVFGGAGKRQTITSGRPLSLTQRRMMGSVTDWYAPLYRREVVRYAGQHAAGFSCSAAVPFQLWYCFSPSPRTRPGKRVAHVLYEERHGR